MTRSIQVIIAVIILSLAGVSQIEAQDDPPTVTVIHPGAEALLSDLEYVTKLAGDLGQEQWKNIDELMREQFLLGIDTNQPIRVDILLDPGAVRYRPNFPIADRKDFETNLDLFGITVRRSGRDFYTLGEAFEGFMRYVQDYASIAEQKGDIPAGMPGPKAAIVKLLEKNYDLAGHFQNSKDDIDERRKAMQSVRDELLAATNQGEDESDEDYKIRKLSIEQDLKELERFFAESSELTMGWITDVANKQGRGEMSMTAIEGTDLEKSVHLIGQRRSKFADISTDDTDILSLRVNFPLDDMRKQHLTEVVEALTPRIKAEVDKFEKTNDAQKAAGRETVDHISSLGSDGIEMGFVDLFTDVSRTDAGKNILVGAVVVPGSEKVIKILESLAKTQDGRSVQFNIDKVGETNIHSVAMVDDEIEVLQDFYGPIKEFYVATGPDVAWYASGDGSLDQLKSRIEIVGTAGDAIKETASAEVEASSGEEAASAEQGEGAAENGVEPAVHTTSDSASSTDGAFFSLKANAGPWIELLHSIRGEEGENIDVRLKAIEAFKSGNDNLSGELRRVDDHIEGSMEIGEGILRFVGRMIAEFSKETLE